MMQNNIQKVVFGRENIKIGSVFKEHLGIYCDTENSNVAVTTLESAGDLNFVIPSGKEFRFISGNKSYGFNGSVQTEAFTLEFKNGLLVKVS